MELQAGLIEPLACPECVSTGTFGHARIGNARSSCPTCNAFAQQVIRWAGRKLRDQYPDDYARLRKEVEPVVYKRIVEARW